MSTDSKIRLWWWSENNTRFWWYPKTKGGNENFGDFLAPFLVKAISGKEAQFTHLKHPLRPKIHLVIGSILVTARTNCIVWGPGIMYRNEKVAKADFRAVRGPCTRKRLIELGYSVPEVYGDPALLLPRYIKDKKEKKYRLGIIPHYVDYEKVKKEIDSEEILVIDLFDPIDKVVDQITSCEMTASSSLHGIIVSHAYEIPSIQIQLSDKISGDGVKYEDYNKSVGISSYDVPNFSKSKIDTSLLLSLLKEKNQYNFIQKDLNILLDKLMNNCPFI